MVGIRALLLFSAGALLMYSLMAHKQFDIVSPEYEYFALAFLATILGCYPGSNRYQAKQIQQRITKGDFVINSEYDAMIKEYLKNNQKIDAIKYYREVSHMGLKDAKDYVDHLERQLQGNHHAL